jgi:23S rRNA (cytosine1962-C5)-methyltransferase
VIEGRAFVSTRGEERIKRGHPWIFRSDVQKIEGGSPGAIVEVRKARTLLGFAFFSDRSEIRLRMVGRGEVLPEDFLARRLLQARALREIVASGAEAFRLVHGEGDGLPGLVVDRYGDYFVVQTLTQGMERLKKTVVDLLVDLFRPKGVLERNDPKVRLLEGLERAVGPLAGTVPETIEIVEAGVTFEVDLTKGQKTGLFLDQRENHQAAASYARGRVLDAFTYNGGFGLAAARQASEVVMVDVSPECVRRAGQNAARNGLKNVRGVDANVFDFLRECGTRRERFDTIILDPPAFAKNKSAVPGARRGYKEINLRALQLLAPGGTLVTCTCSYHLHEAEFEQIVEAAAADAGVATSILEKRRQARDHPVAVGVPETLYLKCLIVRRWD